MTYYTAPGIAPDNSTEVLLRNRRIYIVNFKKGDPYRWAICDIPSEVAIQMIHKRFKKNILDILENGVYVFTSRKAKFINNNIVTVFDRQTGEYYKSQREAARKTGLHRGTIWEHVNRKVPHPRFKRA